MKTYKVISLKSELKSFSWNDGLFIVTNNEDGVIKLCKLQSNGQPERFDDGRLMITCTGSNNDGISQTNLTYTE